MKVDSLIAKTPFLDLLQQIGQVADAEGIEAYAVGGYVRDIFLGRPTVDLDFVSIGQDSGLRLAEAVSKSMKGEPVHVYPSFGTAAIRIPLGEEHVVLEFVGARRESYRSDSRNPIVEAGTLEEDQRRRDFTINAMGIHLAPARFGDLIDPFNGRQDLDDKILRTPLDPVQTFDDDPLRMVRAARFAAQLDFTIEPDTFAGMKIRADRMKILSQERITEELQKIMGAPRPSVGFKILFVTGILQHLFPELTALSGVEEMNGHRHKDNFYHTLQVVDNLVEMLQEKDRPAEETLWLRWSALLHDIAKPRTKRFVKGSGWTFHGHEDRGGRMVPNIFRKLKLPMDDRMRYVQKMVKLHHRPVSLVDDQVTDSAVRRLLFDAGNDIEDLMTLVRADITSKNPKRVRRYLDAFDRVDEKLVEVEEKDKLRNFQPPVDGNEIMQVLNLPPSRAVGKLKTAVREAILEGEIPNDYDAAFAYLMSIKDDILASEE